MKLKNLLIAGASCVLTAAIAVGGTLAYLQSDDSDVNVMTTGSVKIAQHEYERVVDANGNYTTIDVNGNTSYELKKFEQGKALMPATELDANGNPYNYGAGDYDSTWVKMSQVGSHGSMQVFLNPNAVDKFVTVENTGKSDAYVRTLIAFEIGDMTEARFDEVIGMSSFMTADGVWTVTDIGSVKIGDSKYFVCEYVYNGAKHVGGVHDGFLPAGDTSYPSLAQVYMKSVATNEDVEALDGNDNGTYDILVLSQAVQVAGFADAQTALDTAFGKTAEKAAEWFDGVIVPSVKTLAELREAMANGGEYKLAADINVSSAELLYKADGGHSDGSAFLIKADTVLDLNGHNITIDAPGRAADVFFVNGGHNFTVKGNGTVTADCGIFVAYDSATTINIEGGHYKCTASNDMLYAIWGKLNVSGGTYETAYWNLINIYGQGNISLVDVSGGSFKNWSPASSPDGNLLADGYKVVSEVVDGVTWYTVVAE